MIKQFRKKWWLVCGLIALTILTIGARNIVCARSRQLQLRQEQANRWLEWHQMMADEMPRGQQAAWQKAAEEAPELMLRACSVELKR